MLPFACAGIVVLLALPLCRAGPDTTLLPAPHEPGAAARPPVVRGYRVVLTRLPAAPEPLVRVLRALDETLSEQDASDLLATTPVVIADDLSLKEAVEAQQRHSAAGARAEAR